MERGICVALVTPLNEDESIDVKSLEKLLEWVLSSNINGIFVGGTIGEGAALRDSERAVLYRRTVEIAEGCVPILANVSDASTRRSLDLLKIAEEAHVDAVVASARMSFPRRREEETLSHLGSIAKASPVPVWFYEIPATAPCKHSFREIKRILSLDNVVGLKFSSPRKEVFLRCVRNLSNFAYIMTGNTGDIAFAGYEGAFGVISGIGSLFPGLCVRTFQAAISGKREEAERLQAAIASTYSLYGGKGWPYWPTAQKYALVRRGVLRTSYTCAPFIQLKPEEKAQIDVEFDRLESDLFAHG